MKHENHETIQYSYRRRFILRDVPFDSCGGVTYSMNSMLNFLMEIAYSSDYLDCLERYQFIDGVN